MTISVYTCFTIIIIYHSLKPKDFFLLLYHLLYTGIAPHCIESNTIERIEEEKFDGQNWDQHIEKSGIRQRSKE